MSEARVTRTETTPSGSAVASGFAFPVQMSMLRHPLCLNYEFGGQQAFGLVLGGVGAIDNVAHKLRTKGELQVVAIDVPCLLLVNDEQVIALLAHRHIRILACYHVSLGAQDEKSAIPPGTQPVRRKPIQPDVAETVVPTQHHISEILEMGVIRMPHVCDLRSHHFCLR